MQIGGKRVERFARQLRTGADEFLDRVNCRLWNALDLGDELLDMLIQRGDWQDQATRPAAKASLAANSSAASAI